MNPQFYNLSSETLEWCQTRIARQPKRSPSWTPFIMQTVLDLASQHSTRPDINIVKKLWSDFQYGALPQTPLEREFP